MTRRGLTLVELLISMIVVAILGTILTRVLVDDSKFVSRQDAMMSARQTSRAALNTMIGELRMVSEDGLLALEPDSVTFLLPYMFGVSCGDDGGGNLIASFTPPDSLMYANAAPEGLARRDGNSNYVMRSMTGATVLTDPTTCTTRNVGTIPGGRMMTITGIPASELPPTSTDLSPGTIVYLYQTVTYKFAASVDLPGRLALWRRAGAGPLEELVAPFDTVAGFGCLTGPDLDLVACTSSLTMLDEARGLELRLVGESDVTPRGSSGPQTFDLTTRVTFLNRD